MGKRSWVDSLKGIALLGVIFVHSGINKLPSLLGEIGTAGQYGTQMFFVISAFLTFESLNRHFRYSTETISDVFRWWMKKFGGLIPLYYLALVICIFFYGGNGYWLGTEGHITVKNIVFHLIFMHGLIPHYMDSIISVEWYLGVLALFYLIAPLLYKCINSLTKAIFAFSLSFLMPDIFIFLTKSVIPEADYHIYSTYVSSFSIFANLPVLMLGIVVYFILKQSEWKKIEGNKVVSYCLLFVSLVMIVGEIQGMNFLYGTTIGVRYGIWFTGIILSQTIFRCNFVDNRLFSEIGKKSYPIYLFHFQIIKILKNWVFEYWIIIDNGIARTFVITLFTILLSYLVAVVLIKYIDNPCKEIVSLDYSRQCHKNG